MATKGSADYKLAYFGVRGRAEPIRLTLAAGGKKFEDVRLTFEQWPAEKPKTIHGSLPYLEYKGKVYGESVPIAAFVAKECGLAGKTAVDELRVSEVYCRHANLLEAFAKIKFAKTDEAREQAEKTVGEKIPALLKFYEKLITDAGKGYVVGNSLTQADLTVFDITCSLLRKNPKVLDSFPGIQKVRKNVESNAKVKAYLAAAPDLEF